MLDNLGDLERTHSCGELRFEDVEQEVVLMGWVAKKRDFGPLIFVDLRDRNGITQIVFDAFSFTEIIQEPAAIKGGTVELYGEIYDKVEALRGEYVIAIKGEVVAREKRYYQKTYRHG